MRAYFIPKQLREPLENGTKFLFMRGFTPPSQRSGMNSNGLSYTSGSECIMYADMPTGTYENARLEHVNMSLKVDQFEYLHRLELSIVCTVEERLARLVEACA